MSFVIDPTLAMAETLLSNNSDFSAGAGNCRTPVPVMVGMRG